MIRLGLCCIFRDQPISFRQTTASYLRRLSRVEQLEKLSSICLDNLLNVERALRWLSARKIGAFRILSPLFPRYTHPEVGYRIEQLPDHGSIFKRCERLLDLGKALDMRLSLHPDQFNVLSSPHKHVVENSVRELEYQGMVAELIGAEVINVHAGGAYGDKKKAGERLIHNFHKLSARVRSRLTLENDDRSYSPDDLLEICRSLEIPFIYDVHHHRCLPDSLGVRQATDLCLKSWDEVGREPYFHISSPRQGYQSSKPQVHSDYISFTDVPPYWLEIGQRRDITIDVEAKAKEHAVLKLQSDIITHAANPSREIRT